MRIKVKDNLKPHGVVTTELFDLEGNLIEKKVFENLVMNVSKNALAGLIGGETGFTGIINYGAVGTSAASPVATDPQLTAEIARTIVEAGSYSRSANVITMSFYFDPLTGNGLLKEFGAFIDANASANSGFIFDRVNIDVNKTSLKALRITLQATVL